MPCWTRFGQRMTVAVIQGLVPVTPMSRSAATLRTHSWTNPDIHISKMAPLFPISLASLTAPSITVWPHIYYQTKRRRRAIISTLASISLPMLSVDDWLGKRIAGQLQTRKKDPRGEKKTTGQVQILKLEGILLRIGIFWECLYVTCANIIRLLERFSRQVVLSNDRAAFGRFTPTLFSLLIPPHLQGTCTLYFPSPQPRSATIVTGFSQPTPNSGTQLATPPQFQHAIRLWRRSNAKQRSNYESLTLTERQSRRAYKAQRRKKSSTIRFDLVRRSNRDRL